MNKNFLLKGRLAKKLYKFAKELPIIDFHNHLSVTDICEDKRFTDIYELWIKPDPYKHRAMRMCGVDERFITGNASNKEKFETWWKVLPLLSGNPLYLWSKMELSTVFGVKKPIESISGDRAYSLLNNFLSKNNVTANTLFESFGVEYAAPCASICDNFSVFGKNIVPSLRGDDIVMPTKDFIEKLEGITCLKINCFDDFKNAVRIRLELFEKAGGCFSDHALDNGFKFYEDDGKNLQRFSQLLNGTLNCEEQLRLSSYILTFLAKEYSKKGFTLQLHIGAMRKTSSNLLKVAGPAGGYAAIGNSADVKSLTEFLDSVDKSECGLPKVILYTLNPSDNALMSVLSGSYSKDGVSGLITQGAAWWWCDHADGIEEMIKKTMSYGVLANFLGMTTDSRSFLSFVRHDYFRRILCSTVAAKSKSGEITDNVKELKKLIYKICYGNAREVTGGQKNGF